jgi:hypothetical protein
VLVLIALFGGSRLVYFFFSLEGQNWRQTFERHMPTTIATVLCLVFGLQIWLIGLVADLLASSRRLIEESLYRVKKMELEMSALEERGRTLAAALQPPTDGAAPSTNGADAMPPTPAGLVTELERETAGAGAGHAAGGS